MPHGGRKVACMKMNRGLWLGLMAGLVLYVGAATARADTITTFNLNNVSFQDGATASGFLTVDFFSCPSGTCKQLTNWDVDVTGGTDLGAGNAIGFDPADSEGSLTSDPTFDTPIDNGGSLDATPEPGTWALLGGGVLLLAGLAWRRRLPGEALSMSE